MLVLEHGKPMIFGKDRDKGIRLRGLHPEVVTIGAGRRDRGGPAGPRRARRGPVPRARCCRGCSGRSYPVPVGVLRAVARPTHDQLIEGQLAAARRQVRAGRPREGAQRRGDLDGRIEPVRVTRATGRDDVRLHCPVCGFENLTGAEVCDNCGADLAGTTSRSRRPSFHGRLLGEHLDELGAPPPLTVEPGDAARCRRSRRMHETEADCVLVMADDRLVGIFTDRDAVVKAAGKRLDVVPRPRLHDARSGRPPPRRPDRGRHPQDGRRRLPPHPDRRGRPADRRRHGPRRVPPPRDVAGPTPAS